jgi:hypothetical protein
MTTQRPLNSAYNSAKPMGSLSVGNLPPAPMRTRSSGEGMARNIDAKDIPAAPISPGMKRQTSGDVHPYLHGTALQDEPNVPFKSHERPIPIAFGMTDKQRDEVHPIANNANVILKEASTLGSTRKHPAPAPAEKA